MRVVAAIPDAAMALEQYLRMGITPRFESGSQRRISSKLLCTNCHPRLTRFKDRGEPMSQPLHVFVSSVQKELEDERVIVQNLLDTDAFLSAHVAPVLYEFEPAAPDKALKGCLKSLDGCQVYLLIVAAQYGSLVGNLSITHAEYRHAKKKKLPMLAFIKGDRSIKREAGTDTLLKELDVDGPKYKRFGNVIDLQKEVRAALVKLLKGQFGNAVAHRQYEDAGRKIMLEVFSDRVVVSSPGLPPAPITLERLRKGKYRPCSRNPLLAQCLSYFHRVEERGRGFRRMRDQMLDHGLEHPLLGTDTGYFQVTFLGPGSNIDRLRIPETRLLVTPATEAKLSARQRKIMVQALEAGSVTTGWCMETLGVVRDTAHRDLVGLVELGMLVRKGSGRSAKYMPKSAESARDIHPIFIRCRNGIIRS
jgi:predicted HTH transcriptional regulator